MEETRRRVLVDVLHRHPFHSPLGLYQCLDRTIRRTTRLPRPPRLYRLRNRQVGRPGREWLLDRRCRYLDGWPPKHWRLRSRLRGSGHLLARPAYRGERSARRARLQRGRAARTVRYRRHPLPRRARRDSQMHHGNSPKRRYRRYHPGDDGWRSRRRPRDGCRSLGHHRNDARHPEIRDDVGQQLHRIDPGCRTRCRKAGLRRREGHGLQSRGIGRSQLVHRGRR